MLAVRRRHKAFGRGTLRFLYPGNRKVLAYLREYEDQAILCVCNISRVIQAVELRLSDFAGRIPVDLTGGSTFPPIGQLPYLLTLPPFGFYWFILSTDASLPDWHLPVPAPMPELATLDSSSGNQRQEDSKNREAWVRRPADRRSVGWLCRRGGRRLRACWPADDGGRGGDGSGCWRAGRRDVCGRTERAAQPEPPWG